MYKAEVCEKHINSGQLSDLDADAVTMKAGSKVTVAISRTWDDPFLVYVSTATTYNSTSEITGVVDNYKCTVVQVQ